MQTHFTLLAGSRAVLLVQHFGKEEDKAWILPNHGPHLLDTVAKALKDRPSAPLRIVIDCKSLDLKREDLPPVDLVRRQKIVQQQATSLFPKSFLRGAGQWREGNAFYALHGSCAADPGLEELLQQIHKLPNQVESLSFFATEWHDYAEQISAIPPKPWAISLVLSEAMGLRQIVLKDGKAAFTRLHEECMPSQGVRDLAAPIARHLAATRDYLPRFDPNAPKNAPAQLFVPSSLEALATSGEIRAQECRVVVLKTPHAALLPPEWEADMVWATQASQQKLPFLPLVPFWLKERVGSNRLRQVISLLLMAFGLGGIYMGSDLIFKGMHHEDPPAVEVPVVKPPPKVDAPKPPELHLDALVYNSPEDWTVWINGKKFSPKMPERDSIHVTGISTDGAVVRWEKNGASKEYILRPEAAASGSGN